MSEQQKEHQYQALILAEMGIAMWSLKDSEQLTEELAQVHSVSSVAATDEVKEQDTPQHVVPSKSAGSSVLQQLSSQLSGDKKAQSQPVEAPKEEPLQDVQEVLLCDVTGKLAADIILAMEATGRKCVTEAFAKPSRYPLVIAEDAAMSKLTEHYFTPDSLQNPAMKKQLWQLLYQAK